MAQALTEDQKVLVGRKITVFFGDELRHALDVSRNIAKFATEFFYSFGVRRPTLGTSRRESHPER
ncbi:hypothetical protein ACFQ0O_05630 [Saccharopolyspora spinosporotrichia]